MNRVRHTRKKLGLTQPQFAQIVRLNVSTISRMERGKQKNSQILLALCLILSRYYDHMAQLSDLVAGEMMDGELFLQEIREALELDNLN